MQHNQRIPKEEPVKHIAMLAVMAGLLVGCSGEESGGPNEPLAPATASVTTPLVPPPVFIPSTVTIRAGGTVTFKNVDGSPAPHNVRSLSDVWPLTTLDPGESFTVTLNTKGQYPYTCTLHPGMNGTITVK